MNLKYDHFLFQGSVFFQKLCNSQKTAEEKRPESDNSARFLKRQNYEDHFQPL